MLDVQRAIDMLLVPDVCVAAEIRRELQSVVVGKISVDGFERNNLGVDFAFIVLCSQGSDRSWIDTCALARRSQRSSLVRRRIDH
jgi:hypothetical protein